MPKMAVMASGDRPHSAAYWAYRGVGALDPAKKDTVIDASRKKAAFGARVAPGFNVAVFPEARGPGCMSLSVIRQICLYVASYRPVCYSQPHEYEGRDTPAIGSRAPVGRRR
jgi:hypothetical protein